MCICRSIANWFLHGLIVKPIIYKATWASQVAWRVKNWPTMQGDAGDRGLIPGLGGSLEKGMAAHPSILAWKIPWTEEPGGLQSMGSQSRTRLRWLSMHPWIADAGHYFQRTGSSPAVQIELLRTEGNIMWLAGLEYWNEILNFAKQGSEICVINLLPFICTDAIGISSILKEIRHFSFVSKGQGWGLAFGMKYAHNLLNWVDFFLAQKNLLMHLWKPYHQTEQAETKTKLACLRGTFKNLICST